MTLDEHLALLALEVEEEAAARFELDYGPFSDDAVGAWIDALPEWDIA